jgi:ATP-dependent DNA helicase RecG
MENNRESAWRALRKVIELEQTKGCRDSAVLGGLDKFLALWEGPAEALCADKKQLSRLKHLHLKESHYFAMAEAVRREWLAEVLAFLNETEITKPVKTAAKAALPGGPAGKLAAAAPRRTTRSTKSTPPQSAVALPTLDTPITSLKGISTSLGARFGKLGVKTVRDLLYFFPTRHLDYSRLKTISQLTEGAEETITALVWEAKEVRRGARRSTEAIVGDATGNVRIVWFNNPYIARQLPTNSRIVLSGRVSLFQGRHVFQSPEWEILEGEDQELVHTGRFVPVYPLTQGLRQRAVRKLMKEVADQWAPRVPDFLPPEVKGRCRLLDLPEALHQAHYPESEALKDQSRVRLAFDELFLLQLGVLDRKRRYQEGQKSPALNTETPFLTNFLESLPFKFTRAQERVFREIQADLKLEKPMSRLLQGEVGSGKTVIATAALLTSIASGYQAALMAPTEILAEQHFQTICRLLGRQCPPEVADHVAVFPDIAGRSLRVSLLMSDIPSAQKKAIHRQLAQGDIHLAIGTHALIQKDVAFARLGLAVVDEQHRFGVAQRSELRQKGFNPHILVMTATPIPRTLALTLYGDLDLSVIDELPPGRQVIKTKWLRPEQRDAAYGFIRRQVQAGRQAFIICPLVEESETIEAKAAVSEYERLSHDVFPELHLGLLHGRLSAAQKEDVMRRFLNGELHILVSTPVVEVGIDIPNATAMLVESANRFGLSQLHQFRGRVGRGTEQSYCMLQADNPTEVGRERLAIIETTQDGFKLAEEDLRLRGPGEFFGTRQSGLPDLKMARLSDVPLLEMARREATRLFTADPELGAPELAPLVRELTRVWPREGEWS